jgi:hypothetical protein
MRIGENVELYKTNEDLKTSIETILRMPPTVKEAFLKTEEGQFLVKGIVLQSENNRPDNKQFGTSWTPGEIEELNEEIRKASPEDRELILALLPSPVISCLHNRMEKEETLAYDNWTKVKGADTADGGRKDISKGGFGSGPRYGSREHKEKWQHNQFAPDREGNWRTNQHYVGPKPKSPLTSEEESGYKDFIKRQNDYRDGGSYNYGKISKGAKQGTPGYSKWLEEIRAKRAGKVNPDAMTRPTKFDHKQPKQPKPYKHFLRRVKKDAKIVDKPVSEKSENS